MKLSQLLSIPSNICNGKTPTFEHPYSNTRADRSSVASAYNTRPGDEKWNELADLDKNGTVNILDVTMIAKDYGKTV